MSNEVPQGWSLRKVSEFLTESRTAGSNGRDAKKITVKLYGKGVFAKDEPRPGSVNTKYYIRESGQFIYSKLDFLNGAFGIVPDELNGYESTLDLPTFDFSEGLNPYWLLSFFSRESFYKKFGASAIGSRKARRISPSEFLNIELPLPPLPEQKKIAAILSSVDETISKTKSIIEQTKKVKKGLMQKLLTRGIGHTKFKKTEIGVIPEGWESVAQGEVATFHNGRAYKLSEWEGSGTPVIRLQNLTGSGRDFYYSNLELPAHQYAENGELLYMWSASFGPYIWNGGKAIYHYHIWKVECREDVLDQQFMYYSLDRLTDYLSKRTNGSTMLHLTKGGMETHKIELPPLPEQKKIASILTSVDEKIQQEESTLRQQQVLKNSLMQQLLTGKTRVKVS